MEIYRKNEEALISQLSRLKETEVDFEFINAFRAQLMAKIATESPAPDFLFMSSLRLAGVIAALLAAIFSAGGGAVVAAQKSSPSDLLYPVKIAMEKAKLAFAGDLNKANLKIDFAENRLDEIESADKNPQIVVENLERFEKALLSAHEDLDRARSKESGEKLAASAINIESKIVTTEKKLDELRGSLGELAQQPKVAEAIAKAALAAEMGLERSADAVIESSLQANENFAPIQTRRARP